MRIIKPGQRKAKKAKDLKTQPKQEADVSSIETSHGPAVDDNAHDQQADATTTELSASELDSVNPAKNALDISETADEEHSIEFSQEDQQTSLDISKDNLNLDSSSTFDSEPDTSPEANDSHSTESSNETLLDKTQIESENFEQATTTSEQSDSDTNESTSNHEPVVEQTTTDDSILENTTIVDAMVDDVEVDEVQTDDSEKDHTETNHTENDRNEDDRNENHHIENNDVNNNEPDAAFDEKVELTLEAQVDETADSPNETESPIQEQGESQTNAPEVDDLVAEEGHINEHLPYDDAQQEHLETITPDIEPDITPEVASDISPELSTELEQAASDPTHSAPINSAATLSDVTASENTHESSSTSSSLAETTDINATDSVNSADAIVANEQENHQSTISTNQNDKEPDESTDETDVHQVSPEQTISGVEPEQALELESEQALELEPEQTLDPEHKPAETPEELPEQTPEELPQQSPEELPDQTPEELPDESPEEYPQQQPDEMQHNQQSTSDTLSKDDSVEATALLPEQSSLSEQSSEQPSAPDADSSLASSSETPELETDTVEPLQQKAESGETNNHQLPETSTQGDSTQTDTLQTETSEENSVNNEIEPDKPDTKASEAEQNTAEYQAVIDTDTDTDTDEDNKTEQQSVNSDDDPETIDPQPTDNKISDEHSETASSAETVEAQSPNNDLSTEQEVSQATTQNTATVTTNYRQTEDDGPTASEKIKQFLIKVDSGVRYFKQCYQEDKHGAIKWWLKTNKEQDELKQAISRLSYQMNDEDFTLDKIWSALSDFTLKPEDVNKLKWFEDAHHKIIQITTALKTGRKVERPVLQKLQNQLRFIANSEEFSQKYGLEKARKEVFKMYKHLTQVLDELKKIEREKMANKENEQKLEARRLAKEKAEAEAQKEKLEVIKHKEARLQAQEEKKKALAFKEAEEAEMLREEKLAELKAQEAEQQRQLQLQGTYLDMQVQDKISALSIKELSAMLSSRVNQSELSEDDQKSIEDLKVKLIGH